MAVAWTSKRFLRGGWSLPQARSLDERKGHAPGVVVSLAIRASAVSRPTSSAAVSKSSLAPRGVRMRSTRSSTGISSPTESSCSIRWRTVGSLGPRGLLPDTAPAFDLPASVPPGPGECSGDYRSGSHDFSLPSVSGTDSESGSSPTNFPSIRANSDLDILDRAPYQIIARFDGADMVTIASGSTRSTQVRWNGQGELMCGAVGIRLLAFDLEGEAIARIGPRMEVRAWLKEWTGVSIYRDGFRIWPYGEPHDDWLRLDQRRVNNPVEHLSNNQVIGFIDTGRDSNPELMDQTNREGLMNNRAFEDLRRLVYLVFQILEAERQSVRHPVKRDSSADNGHPGARRLLPPNSCAMQRASRRNRSRDPKAWPEDRGSARAERAGHERLVDGYAGLAAAGQMTALLLPALPREVEHIREEVFSLQRALAATGDPCHHRSVDRLVGGLASVSERMKLLQVAGNNDRRRAIDIAAELEAFRELTFPVLESRGVKLDVECLGGEVIRTEMRPESFHCLLQILTSNSLDWMPSDGPRRIRVVATADEERCEIIFSDTGPGIPLQHSSKVFDPRFSTKEDGRGMGLTIARRLVESHLGQMSVVQDGRRRGANIRIILPRKRSRALSKASDEHSVLERRMMSTHGDIISTVVDLFSGAGGLSLGFQAAGAKILASADVDEAAARSYAENFARLQPDSFPAVFAGDEGDLEDFDYSRIAQGEVTILIGGPPCQGFSRLGRAKIDSLTDEGFEGDPRNELYKQFLHAVSFWRPAAVVMENVPGMLSVGERNVADDAGAELGERGYEVGYAVLNAVWYGVPQYRERLFFIAFNKSFGIRPSMPRPTHFSKIPSGYLKPSTSNQLQLPFVLHYELPVRVELATLPCTTVLDALADLPVLTDHLTSRDGPTRGDFRHASEYSSEPRSSYARLMRRWPGLPPSGPVVDQVIRRTPRDYEIFRAMRPGDRYPQAIEIATRRFDQELERLSLLGQRPGNGTEEFESLKGRFVPPYPVDSFLDKSRKLIPDQPSWTVPAHLSKDAYSHIHYDSDQARAISIREAARLQSFPDSFAFFGNMGDCYRQIGNAVHPASLGHRLRGIEAPRSGGPTTRLSDAVTPPTGLLRS